MLTLIGKVDQTINIPHDSISLDSVAGDPLGKAKFTVIDSGAQIPLQVQQEVIVFDENVALTPSGVVASPFTDTYATNDISSYTSTNNPSGSPSTWTLTPTDTNHALSTYIANAVSATLSTANQLYTINGGTPSSVNDLVTCNASTGWGEIVAQGSAAAWPSLGAIGAPSGKGFFLDATTLEGKTVPAGNWTGSVRISANAAGTITANLTVCVYKYSSGVYTNLVTFVLSGQSWTTTIATASLPTTTGVSLAFATGDKLYIDYWANITANTSGAGQQVRMNRLSTDTAGKTGDVTTQINSTGYSTTNQGTLAASGGSSALLLLNNWTAQNMTVAATMTQSDAGGLVFNVVDASNYYELAVFDASSPSATTTYVARGLNSTLIYNAKMQLYKTVGGVRSAIGVLTGIYFIRGTSHTVSVSTSNNGTSTLITAAFDGVQNLTYTDSASPFGVGQAGLRNDVVGGASSAIYTSFSATSNDIPSLVTSVPAHNYLANSNFNYGGTFWTDIGPLTGRFAFPSNPTYGAGALATLSFSNNIVSTATLLQDVTAPYPVVGQKYCFSATVNVTVPFTNAFAQLVIFFRDGNNGILGGSNSALISTLGSQRVSVTSLAAPSGTISVEAQLTGTTTNTTNSGTATFTGLQLEPVWFPNLYTYPTSICDILQSDCVLPQDNTACRFDRVFTGFITHLTATYEGNTRIWDVEATSTDVLLETAALINASYTNVTDLSIIQGIVNNLPSSPYFLLNASDPSLLTPNLTPADRNAVVCVAGVTIAALQFSDATIREIINTLADTTGFLYGVDPYYNVYYYPPFYRQAPYTFSSTPDYVTSFPYYDYSIEYDGTQLKNALRVVGTTYQIVFVEAWKAQDGSHAEGTQSGNTVNAILFHNPIAVPSSVVVGGSSRSCGLDTNTGFGSSQCLCNTSWPYISFLTSIAPTTTISITYTYEALVYVQIQAPDSVAKYNAALYGKINDTNLGSNASAVTRGEAELQAYSQPRITIKFKTQKMIQVGQVIVFTSALDGLIGAHYTVQKVTASYLGNSINQYDIEAGTYVDDFVDFFRNTQKALGRVDHNPTEAIKQVNNLQQDSLSVSDSLNIHT